MSRSANRTILFSKPDLSMYIQAHTAKYHLMLLLKIEKQKKMCIRQLHISPVHLFKEKVLLRVSQLCEKDNKTHRSLMHFAGYSIAYGDGTVGFWLVSFNFIWY